MLAESRLKEGGVVKEIARIGTVGEERFVVSHQHLIAFGDFHSRRMLPNSYFSELE